MKVAFLAKRVFMRLAVGRRAEGKYLEALPVARKSYEWENKMLEAASYKGPGFTAYRPECAHRG